MGQEGVTVLGEWLVQPADQCTCQGPGAHYGHQPGCGYEPLLRLDEVAEALRRAGYAVVELPKVETDQWGDRQVELPDVNGGRGGCLRVNLGRECTHGYAPSNISSLGVPNPIGSEDARLVAAGMLALADAIDEEEP